MKSRRAALIALGAGTLLFALAPPVLKLLTGMGNKLDLDRPGAISFCNVLFVGNLCAGLVTLFLGGPRRIWAELASLNRRTKRYLVLGALVSVVYPALLFTGLERTTVIDVVLLSRFNGIIFVALAWLFLKTMVRRAELVGYGVIAIGVAALVIMNNHGVRISSGESFVLASSVFFALTEIASKNVLRECSIQTYVFFRNFVSSIAFFAIGLFLFGPDHFADAFSGELWVLMIVYAGIAVVAAQVLWLKGTRSLPAQAIANFQLLSPALTITFAWLVLSETPSVTEWSVMGVIVVGMLIPRVVPGKARGRALPRMTVSPEMGLAGR